MACRNRYARYTLVDSGDTGANGPNMVTLAQGADLFICDTAITDTLPPNPIFHKLHTSPTRIGEVAAAAKVKKLVLSHLTPVSESHLDEIKAMIRNNYHGKIKVAQDLKVFNLSASDH